MLSIRSKSKKILKITLDKLEKIEKDPVKFRELGSLMGGLFKTYVEFLAERPSFAVEFLSDGRLQFVGTLPPGWSHSIKTAIERGLFLNVQEVFSRMIGTGYRMIDSIIKDVITNPPIPGTLRANLSFQVYEVDKNGHIRFIEQDSKEKIAVSFAKMISNKCQGLAGRELEECIKDLFLQMLR